MFLGTTLDSARSGLDSIERQLALISQNVANAGTPNYVRETLPLSSLSSAGGPMGVRAGQATRVMDEHLQADLFAAGAEAAGAKVTQTALERIDQVSGSPGSGQDLPSLLGALRDAFSGLGNDPGNETQQRNVVDRAQSLANGIYALSGALVRARQSAQDSLAEEVNTANDALRSVGRLSDQITLAKSRGQSTAELEDQRDGAMRSLAQLTGTRFAPQPNGDVMAIAGNQVLSLRVETGPFSLGSVNFSGGTPASAVPALMINGHPVESLGGEMGAHLKLRDGTLPNLQAGLDGFAYSLSETFANNGLPLFSDGTATVPASGSLGFSAIIQVSDAVQAAPSMVRDGTAPAGAVGDTSLLNRVLDNVFGAGASSLSAQATSLVARHASLAAEAASAADTSGAVRTGLENKLGATTGVSIDRELADMIRLQNAYAANAKVMAAVQEMWSQLLGSVR